MSVDLKRLGKLADEASPGPWTYFMRKNSSVDHGVITIDYDGPYIAGTVKRVWQDDQGRRCTQFLAEVNIQATAPEKHQPTTEFIADANPAVVRELLDLLKEAKVLLTEVRPAGDADWPLGKEIDAWLKGVKM